MKSHFKYCLLFLSFVFIASSCQKEEITVEDELPPITQEGLNTFGCKIDGEVLVPKDGTSSSLFSFGSTKGLTAGNVEVGIINDEFQRYFYIQGINTQEGNGDYVFLYIPNLKTAGEYKLGNSTGSTMYENYSPNHAVVFLGEDNNVGETYLSFENGGEINITRYDSINSIVSGTFEFDVVKESDPLSDTISVIDGRFDINWSTLNEEE